MSLKIVVIVSCNFLMKGIKKAKGLAENFKQNVEIKLVWQVISVWYPRCSTNKMKETKIYECFNVAYIRNLIKS